MKKPPPVWRGFDQKSQQADQPADDDETAEDDASEAGAIGAGSDDEAFIAGASTDDEAGASDDEAGAGAADDEAGASEDEAGAGASDDEAGAADDEEEAGAGASDELAALDGAVFTGVVAGRLNTKIRPMITITATMMIIQVLRFIGVPLFGEEFDWEECRFL